MKKKKRKMDVSVFFDSPYMSGLSRNIVIAGVIGYETHAQGFEDYDVTVVRWSMVGAEVGVSTHKGPEFNHNQAVTNAMVTVVER